ncbi:MAG: hypothetical protein ACPG5W_02005, partial [Flavobacteriales bacterium]
MKNLISILFFSLLASASFAQVVSTDIAYITVEDSVTLTFNSNEGNAALSGTNPVYIHTGLIKDNSDYSGDWKRQVGLWGETESYQLMTSQGSGIHSKGINIEDFYGTGTWDGVRALAMVFRNADGSTVG